MKPSKFGIKGLKTQNNFYTPRDFPKFDMVNCYTKSRRDFSPYDTYQTTLRTRRNFYLNRNIKIEKQAKEKEEEIDKINDEIESLRLDNFQLDEQIKYFSKRNSNNELKKHKISNECNWIKEMAKDIPNAVEKMKKLKKKANEDFKQTKEDFNKKISELDITIASKQKELDKYKNELKAQNQINYETKVKRYEIENIYEAEKNTFETRKEFLIKDCVKLDSLIEDIKKKLEVNKLVNELHKQDNEQFFNQEEEEQNDILYSIEELKQKNEELKKQSIKIRNKMNSLKKEVAKIQRKK